MSPQRRRRQDTQRRVDAGIRLLTGLREDSVDPDYARVARERGPSRSGLVLGVVTVAFGLMVGTAVSGTLRAAPVTVAEREDLITRVQAATTSQDALQAQLARLTDETRALSAKELPSGPAGVAGSLTEQLEALAGSLAVAGPGVLLLVDDAPEDAAGGEAGRVVDQDLRQAVNSLWESGAEAIAINGHRLSVRSAIRGAGSAITVDYRSLSAPYRIEAIGDADAMSARFPGTRGGAWWAYLRKTYDMRYELSPVGELRLPADPGLGVRHAGPIK